MDINSRIGRVARIGSWVRAFFDIDMTNSAIVLIELQILLANSADFSTLQSQYLKFTGTAQNEFAIKTRGIRGYNQHRADCYQLMSLKVATMLITNFKNLQNWFPDILSLIEERTKALKNWQTLVRMFTKKEFSDEEKILGLNLLYLAKVEGFFDKDLKICYSWIELAEGKIVDMEEIDKMEIYKIKQNFESRKLDMDIFEGWNRNLRNAIAHFDFKYDGERKLMVYEHKHWDNRTKQLCEWRKELTYKQLLDLSQKLVNVNELVTALFGIMMVRDTCFAGNDWK